MVDFPTQKPEGAEAIPEAAGDGPAPGTAPSPPDPHPGPKPLAWLIGGFALGLAVGIAAAGRITATKDFFRAPGWGWAAADAAAQSLLGVR